MIIQDMFEVLVIQETYENWLFENFGIFGRVRYFGDLEDLVSLQDFDYSENSWDFGYIIYLGDIMSEETWKIHGFRVFRRIDFRYIWYSGYLGGDWD